MRKTRLGETELDVSRICFGTWQAGGEWGELDTEHAKRAARRALELGINFFDTAQGYGWGRSERLLREALEPELRSRRDEIVIATKGGLRMDGDAVRRDSSPQWLRQGIEHSLRELGTDHVDLYQVHWPDPEVPFAETAGALEEFVQEGKARYIGVSNFDAAQMAEFGRARKVDALQPPYHLFRREIEGEILPFCREHGIGVLVYSPLAHGLLTGKFDESTEFPNDDWRRGSSVFQGEEFTRNLTIVRELARFAEGRGWTVAQLAIAWTLATPGVDCAIVGARTPEHIEGTAPAGEIELSDEDLRDVGEVLEGAVPVGGPSPEAR
jgi:aryl-alcohol dehydrogenase-like predicted oxidoreductase